MNEITVFDWTARQHERFANDERSSETCVLLPPYATSVSDRRATAREKLIDSQGGSMY